MKRSEFFFTTVLIPIDFFALIAAAVAGFYARFHPAFTTWRPVAFELTLTRYLGVVSLIALVWLAFFAFAGLYTTRRVSIASELTRVFLACSTSMAAVFAILFFSRVLFESRFIAVASWFFAIMFVCMGRLCVRALQRILRAWGVGEHRIVMIGRNETSKALEELFSRKHWLGFHIVAHFTKFDEAAAEEIRKLKRTDKVDEILLADPEADRKTTLALLSFTDTEHLGFRFSADLFAAAVGRSVIHTFAGIPIIEVQKTPLDGWGAIYKRIFDIVCALILIILTLPIQIVVAIALFVEQPGRILFSRTPEGKKLTRIGQGSKPFHYFKFRSMIKDAHKYRFDPEFIKQHGNEREGTPLFKLKEDPRVTRVGKFIRKFSIDEIPEFYLVLLGRMSLVGPRPHMPEEVAEYKPHQRKVLTIKPGITGMAQISGRADLDFESEVRLDVYYIEHWSPWLDLYILLKTPLVVLFRKGAY